MKNWIDDVVSPHVKDRIAWMGALEFTGATEDDKTGRTVQFRIIRKPEEMHSAHPFSRYTRRRRGHAGTRFGSVFSSGEEAAMSGEVMLLNWADGPSGATVKFLLDSELGQHPFLHCTRRSAEGAGDTFMAVLMELDDDDEVINQTKRERYEKTQQKLSNVAAMMAKHNRFHEWLRETVGDEPWEAAGANEWLKRELGISSKAELDGKNRDAIRKFEKIRAKYGDWLTSNHYDRE